MLIYLNDGYDGGETEFQLIGLCIKERADDVVLFANLDQQEPPNL